MPPIELTRRLLLAAALGAAIGLERELRRKPAGLRTNILIALGSALFTTVSLELAGVNGGTSDRITAQIVTGIGFLGAGAIMRHRESVHGLTTAATIWVNAAVGVAAGAGRFATATVATILTLVVLAVLGPAEQYFERRSSSLSAEDAAATSAPDGRPSPRRRR
ncbi:MAG TPA: MgtC/SapB family protein [Vicinamibacterales bacterium]|nr:MgtC/SapB family protein [Vicinamibacterales bacterium]